jgi:catechol 2,3-dioxygenase-like lactoylglutathione lyase family enzyme
MPIVAGGRTTHTTLECRNVAASVRFYCDVMGLRSNQAAPGVGHLMDTKGHYAAVLQNGNPGPQPFLNFYARPVAGAAEVDAAHGRIAAVRETYGIAELTAPAREDPARFGVASYGFYLKDLDGNWWRVEDNDGPFGAVELPGDAVPRGSIVPAGPISYVMLESRSLPVSVRFYRELLGLVVAEPAAHYCLVSDPGGLVRVITVEVGDRLVPQKVANHHGITFTGDPAQIDVLRERVAASAAELGIKKVFSATSQHGAYAFYLQDADTNCWELEVWDQGVNQVLGSIESREQVRFLPPA